MATVVLLLVVLVFSMMNVVFGVCLAGFFGIGPFRGSALVRFISDPIITPPRLLRALSWRRAVRPRAARTEAPAALR